MFCCCFLAGEPSILPDFCSLHAERREERGNRRKREGRGGIHGEKQRWDRRERGGQSVRMASSVVHTVHGIISKSITAAERVSVYRCWCHQPKWDTRGAVSEINRGRQQQTCVILKASGTTALWCWSYRCMKIYAHPCAPVGSTQTYGFTQTHHSSVGGGAAALKAAEVLKKI